MMRFHVLKGLQNNYTWTENYKWLGIPSSGAERVENTVLPGSSRSRASLRGVGRVGRASRWT